jgi:hypothetical protein
VVMVSAFRGPPSLLEDLMLIVAESLLASFKRFATEGVRPLDRSLKGLVRSKDTHLMTEMDDLSGSGTRDPRGPC